MDLRLHAKSGNDYYVDISNYDYGTICESVSDSMSRGDILKLENENQVNVINCKELEYFEIITNDEIKEESMNNQIGFKNR